MDYKSKMIKEKLILLLSNSEGLSTSEISETLQITKAAATNYLRKLKDAGKVIEISQGKKRIWRCANIG